MEAHKGLTSLQAKKLLNEFGPNEIVERKSTSLVSLFFGQFRSLLVILLIVAAAISLLLGESLDGVFILLIVFLNAVLGFIQEYKADQALSKLKQLTVSQVRVVRDGLEKYLDSRSLVPGDLINIEAGDKVPVDCRLVHGLHLEVNESALTGESLPVEKSLESLQNTLFMGTIIVKGRGKAVVMTIGMSTRFGQIAASLSEIKKTPTPLEQKLDKLGKQLGLLAIFASCLVFFIGYLNQQPILEMFLTSISLAVAAVPEGLPAVVTITLALGMQRMARQKAILRKLAAIETLGSTTVIATDKTGTLTTGKMRVAKLWFDGKMHEAGQISHVHDTTLTQLLNCSVICNNASLVFTHDHGQFDVLGDPTEGAILVLAHETDKTSISIKDKGKLIDEFAFDPNSKMMSVVWQNGGQNVYTKGAPETVVDLCKNIMMQGELRQIDARLKTAIGLAYQELARLGMRVLALAYKPVDKAPVSRETAETELTFLGLVGIADPARAEVKAAITIAETAGIRSIMITGDNELTANSIATKIGLIKSGEEILTGGQLDGFTDDQLREKLTRIRIFARTVPEHKLRIVKLLQKSGAIVAVTGDGINDALALKQADVGVAMGSGTDVAKEAADMVITDDNYASLVAAIAEGRVIFDNIKHAIKYLIGCNLGEVLAVTVGMLLGWPVLYTPLQLLYINLVTDGLPAIALAVSPRRERIMERLPRRSTGLFEAKETFWFLEVSVITAVLGLFTFYLGWRINDLLLARTLSFTTIIIAQYMIFIDLWVRDKSLYRHKMSAPSLMLASIGVPVLVQLFILYQTHLAKIFKVKALSLTQLLLIGLLSLVLVLAAEIRKTGWRRS